MIENVLKLDDAVLWSRLFKIILTRTTTPNECQQFKINWTQTRVISVWKYYEYQILIFEK